MTDRDNIELPPLPPSHPPEQLYGKASMLDYGRDCFMAGLAAARAEPAKPVKPKVHSGWIELSPDCSWTINPGLASYHSTSTMLHLCWTDDGRVWIDSKDSRSLARFLRSMYCDPLILAAADALDGGVR